LYLSQWIKWILSSDEADRAYKRLTSGGHASLTVSELNKALSVFFPNDFRHDWLLPLESDQLNNLPQSINGIADSLREIDANPFFCHSTELSTGLPELAQRLDRIAEIIRERTVAMRSLRQGRAKHSEFDYKLRLAIPTSRSEGT
jgi:hypothetical protein